MRIECFYFPRTIFVKMPFFIWTLWNRWAVLALYRRVAFHPSVWSTKNAHFFKVKKNLYWFETQMKDDWGTLVSINFTWVSSPLRPSNVAKIMSIRRPVEKPHRELGFRFLVGDAKEVWKSQTLTLTCHSSASLMGNFYGFHQLWQFLSHN